MSYNRNYNQNRRRGRDDYEQRQEPQVFETPEDRLRTVIIRLGEVDPIAEIASLAKHIQGQSLSPTSTCESLRVALVEQPHKIPHYAALLTLLHAPVDGVPGPPLGKQILDDMWKGFQGYLDKLAWRETRLCVQFFAHLTMAKVVSPRSLISLLQSFTTVLEEFGVSNGRAKRAALCTAEGLMIAGPILKASAESEVATIIGAIKSFNDTSVSQKWLVQPAVQSYSEAAALENGDELLDAVLSCLEALSASDFAEISSSYLQPYADYPPLPVSHILFELPSVLVPPEIIELDGLSNDSADAQVKKEEWPEYYIRIFDNDISPDPNTPAGFAVRSTILDMIDIFEVNRKECARFLLEFPKWTIPGTFKPKPGASTEVAPVPGKDWQLESTIIETILGALLLLPEPSHKSVYYISLITELCKLSPSTVGPAVGKSIRKLYTGLAYGLDVEVARRFAEWFAVHMSNFGFQWVWKEWVPDLELTMQHPKRAFMRRALEFEIRLSYHQRILQSLPDPMKEPSAYTIQEEAPGPDFIYSTDRDGPHVQTAQEVLSLLRSRVKPEDVIAHLDNLRTTLESSDSDVNVTNVDALIRSIAIQSILELGSRSFSHLLNAIERYLLLLRALASGTLSVPTVSGAAFVGNAEAKADILSLAAEFWRRNRQMVAIVFDKLMQYQIVDPNDVVAWTFANRPGVDLPSGVDGPLSLNAFEWDLLKGALDKANGRVRIARRRVIALRKEEDETRAKAKAGVDNSMEVDVDTKEEETTDNPALTTALKAFASLTREQKAALSRTLEGFVACLAPAATDAHPNPHSRQVLDASAWESRSNWGSDEWNAWETWGWYRQFCRTYSPYLRTYATTLSTVSFTKFEGSTDPAAELLKKTWNVAIGQE